MPSGDEPHSSVHTKSQPNQILGPEESPQEARTPHRVRYLDKYGTKEDEEKQDVDFSEKMWGFSHGEHPELWYKFKRFETLGLHNLYLLQDQLVRFQRDLDWRGGEMTKKDAEKLGALIKQYYESIQLFKDISQMKRPTMKQRQETATRLRMDLAEAHYSIAADALGMVDLTPQALGVEPDTLRIVLGGFSSLRALSDDTMANYAARENARKVQDRTPTQGQLRPLQVSAVTDNIARIIMAIISGVLLLVPVIVLSYLETKGYRLLATCLFVLAFAVIASVAVTGTNNELVTATAAYAAILVVFLGQTS